MHPFAPKLGFVVFRVISFCRSGECLTHEAVHSQNGALYPFGCQLDVGKSGDRSSAHTAAIVQPENATTSPELGRRNTFDEAAVNLTEKNGLFDGGGGRSERSTRRRGFVALGILEGGEEASGTAFRRPGCFEVVVNDVCGDDLQETEDGAGILGTEVLKQAAIVGAEFEVGFLSQIIDETWYRFAPLACSSENDRRNQRVKAADELGPHLLIPSRDTSREQLTRG